MQKILGSRAFLELLKQEGVDILFGNPGTTELPLMDAFVGENDINYVLGLQESAVIGMADGYAQTSGKIGVVNVHAAPGLATALGMLYNSSRAGTPLLITAGQHDRSVSFSEPMAWGDMPPMARPFVKWSGEVSRLADLPRAVHRAIKIALTPPTGPVFLSIPVDVLIDEAEIDLGAPTRIGAAIRPDAESLKQAAALLAKSERPAIMVGDAVSTSNALDEIVALAELVGAPVFIDGVAAAASFPSSHPLFAGTIGRLGANVRKKLSEFDLLFSAGGEVFMLSLPSEVEPLPESVKLIHLDDNPHEIGKNFPVDVALFGNAKATLPELTRFLGDALGANGKQKARTRRDSIKAKLKAERDALFAAAEKEAQAPAIRIAALWRELGAALPKDIIVLEETISSLGRMQDFMPADTASSFYGMRGGGIGWGVPSAVGAKLANPDRPVIGITGDGSALYASQAMWTAANQKLRGLVWLVLNNGGYRILKQRTKAFGGRAAASGIYPAMDLSSPAIDYAALAAAYGIPTKRVTKLSEIKDAVQAGLKSDRPLVLDVVMDPEF